MDWEHILTLYGKLYGQCAARLPAHLVLAAKDLRVSTGIGIIPIAALKPMYKLYSQLSQQKIIG